MARLTQLDVVNGCLKTMGESPLNAIDNDHPFVQAGLLALNTALTVELARGWWFNTDEVRLKPDAITGHVYVPADTLDIDSAWAQLVQRGSRLYDRTNQTYDLRDFVSAESPSAIVVKLVREIPFDDLPTPVQHLVAARTWLDFQSSYDADGARTQQLDVDYRRVNATLKAQHIRNSNVNLFNSPGVADKMRRIRPRGAFRHLGRRN